MKLVCPMPGAWNDIYQKLLAAWKSTDCIGLPPPVPLILAGWVFSSDFDKRFRWEQTLAWAANRGLGHLIPALSETEQYRVVALSSSTGPDYGSWSFDPKPLPSATEVTSALRKLKETWPSIAGPELAEKTEPIDLTGDKRRRLVVLADASFQPSWGSWNRFMPGANRKAFTCLRRAVNAAIAPHVVDHIEFIATNSFGQENTGPSPKPNTNSVQ